MRVWIGIVRHLAPGLAAITMAAAVLLLSDFPKAPRSSTPDASLQKRPPVRVALLQMSSQSIMDDAARQVIVGLEDAGYQDGATLKLVRLNAEGDMATANAMATEVVGGDYDLVVTLSTPCLQAVANANRRGEVKHVFGLVSDPTVSGVGIGKDPLAHPAYMVGIGTLPPAEKSFQLARQINPSLKRVGVVWNPAEVNSEIATKVARQTCQELGIELLEANAENTSSVREAVASLIARDVEALWIGGDITVLSAVDLVVQLAAQAKIPVFTCMPGNAAKGALFDVGANYSVVGHQIGQLAGRVLSGEEIANIPWEVAIPPKLFLNTTVTDQLQGAWKFPKELLESADSIIDSTGEVKKDPPAKAPATSRKPPQQPLEKPLAKRWVLRLVSYVNSIDAEDAERGVREGLKSSGLVEHRDFEWKSFNAQGDMASLTGLVDAALSDQPDLLLTVSTQAVQAAVQRTRDVPVVFTMVANPVAAGLGKSDADHLPAITGAYGVADAEGMMPLIRQLLPQARKLGTLYSPTEVNSVFNFEVLSRAVEKAGYKLASSGVNTSSEVPDAAQALCDQGIDAICLTNSNLVSASFPGVIQAARRAKLPVFAFLGSVSEGGAVVVLARDYFEMGKDSGAIAARVMRGESPRGISWQASTRNRLLINLPAARECGLTIPESMLKSANRIIE